MLRLLTMLFLGIMVGWFLFFVNMDKKSIVMHLADVWHSPVVQQKVKMVQRRIPERLQDVTRVPVAVPTGGLREAAEHFAEHFEDYEEHSESERRGMDALVQTVEDQPKQR